MDCRFEVWFPYSLTGWPTRAAISHSKDAPLIQCDESIPKVKKKKIRDPEPSVEFGTFIGDRQITLILDIKAHNESNCSEQWRKRHARHKGQKKAIFVALLNCKQLVSFPCVLKFIRFAPKELDRHDNLPMAFKWICDQVCAELTGELRPGLADSNKGFTFKYDQVKSKNYYVKIEISW